MGVLIALIAGLVWWIVAWSFGVKAFDAFLLTVALVVAAAALRIAMPFLNQLLGRETPSTAERAGP
ncbi:MAG: hypothetical protein ACM3UV_00355 [Nocardioidaceae bacterium]